MKSPAGDGIFLKSCKLVATTQKCPVGFSVVFFSFLQDADD